MISKESSSECYVYITLPGETSSVTAGRFVLEKTAQAQALGRFVYGRSYLKNPDAVEFDPIELKLSTRTYETTQLQGVFGALHRFGKGVCGKVMFPIFRVEMFFDRAHEGFSLTRNGRVRKVIVHDLDGNVLRHPRQVQGFQLLNSNRFHIFIAKLLPSVFDGQQLVFKLISGHNLYTLLIHPALS